MGRFYLSNGDWFSRGWTGHPDTNGVRRQMWREEHDSLWPGRWRSNSRHAIYPHWRQVWREAQPWQVIHDFVWRRRKHALKSHRWNKRKELIKLSNSEHGTGNKLLDNAYWVRELSSYI